MIRGSRRRSPEMPLVMYVYATLSHPLNLLILVGALLFTLKHLSSLFHRNLRVMCSRLWEAVTSKGSQ